MGRFIDLTGRVFGRLTVIKRDKTKITPNGTYKTMWECKCDCDTFTIVSSESLRNGLVVSCGCYNKEVVSKEKLIDLTGMVFGRLKVIKRDFNFVPKTSGIAKWVCECECGEIKSILGESLRSGKTISCGCYRRDVLFDDLTDNKYGDIIVLKFYGKGRNNESKWVCKCFCGKEFITSAACLKNGDTKSCGCLSESKLANETKRYFTKRYRAKEEYKIVKNPKTNFYLPYDIYIPYGDNPDLNGFYVEIHGSQHYEKNHFYDKTEEEFEYQKYKDKIKRSFAKKNGVYIEIDIRKVNTFDLIVDKIEKIILRHKEK